MSSTQDPTPAEPDDGPQIEDLFPEGERVTLLYPFSPKRLATGIVVGYVEGLYDHGSPERGPGPVETGTMLVVACDDGRTRRVYPGDAEPEELA